MKQLPQRKQKSDVKKADAVKKSKEFFTVPPKKTAPEAAADFRMRLGGVPLETKAGFELIAYRLRRLIDGAPEGWQEIDREEIGAFFPVFRKYHIPLLIPFYILFTARELFHFTNTILFIKHVFIYLPILTGVYAAYLFLLGVIAEETAEYSGGRFSPQSGTRIALFSSLILSFFSVAAFLPVAGIPLVLFAFILHIRQLFAGARALLNLSESNYRLYRLSHLLVWIFLGLSAFAVLSLVSFIFAKLGWVAI